MMARPGRPGADRPVREPGPVPGGAGPRERHSLRAVRDEFKIRYRVDGALYEMAPPPKHLALPVISRIKVMANLNIAERRLPQDGRISCTIGGRHDRPARLHAADPVRRIGRAARAGPQRR